MEIPNKYYMSEPHNPEKGEYGDCFRACIATLMQVLPSNVPHFFEDGDVDQAWKKIHAWLATQGYSLFSLPLYSEGGAPLQPILDYIASVNKPDVYYLFNGIGGFSGDSHVVVCRGNRIVHDPNPKGINGHAINGAKDGWYWVHVLLPSNGFVDRTAKS